VKLDCFCLGTREVLVQTTNNYLDHADFCEQIDVGDVLPRMWWSETGLVSRVANGICNLQILKGAVSVKKCQNAQTFLQVSCKFSP